MYLRKKREHPKRVYFYGLDEAYKLVHFYFCPKEELSIWNIRATGKTMRHDFPNVRYVFAVDNSALIYMAYRDLRRQDSTENRVEFKMMLEQYGIEI